MDSRTEKTLVLIVDPDDASRTRIRESLAAPDLDLRETAGAARALEMAQATPPDLVITDLILEDGSGFGLCRALRENVALAHKPIVLVSAWSREPDRILGFECGADDFVSKPFFARELVSRVRAVLRRSARPASADARTLRDSEDQLLIDPERGEARVGGERVELTPREFELLSTLAVSGGRVLSRSELIERAWADSGTPNERSVDAHIKSLRRKLGPARDTVKTVRGLGYRFADEASSGSNSVVSVERLAGDRIGPKRY